MGPKFGWEIGQRMSNGESGSLGNIYAGRLKHLRPPWLAIPELFAVILVCLQSRNEEGEGFDRDIRWYRVFE